MKDWRKFRMGDPHVVRGGERPCKQGHDHEGGIQLRSIEFVESVCMRVKYD